MIVFNKEKEKSEKYKIPGWREWTKRTDEFLEEYKNNTGVDCSTQKRQDEYKEFCDYPLTNLGDCKGGNYGYDSGEPCILLKLNRIYGLIPDYYNDEAKLPNEMPEELRARIAGATNKNQVWVSCKGEGSADKEGMGEFSYYPKDGGFQEQYFPYLNQDKYQSPIVAVKFKNTNVGQFVHVECRAWADNIGYDRRERTGIAHFEMIIHDKKTADAVDNA